MRRSVQLVIAIAAVVAAFSAAPAFAQVDNQDPCWMYDPIGSDCTGLGSGGGGGYSGSCSVCVQSITVRPDGSMGPVTYQCKTLYELGLTGTGQTSCSGGGSSYCQFSGPYCQSVSG